MKSKLILGDCIEVMKKFPDNSIDLVLTDPPYGTTNCKWDSIIPIEDMWRELNRIGKPNSTIILFASEPFTSVLITSNIKKYKHSIVWDKILKTGHLNAKKLPMKQTEDIVVFYVKNRKTTYNPIMVEGEKQHSEGKNRSRKFSDLYSSQTNEFEDRAGNTKKYPSNLLRIQKIHSSKCVHPTQKPVELMEYLVKTFSNEKDLVLDFTMGSGTTGVACRNTGRNFIGIEKDETYYNMAKERIEST